MASPTMRLPRLIVCLLLAAWLPAANSQEAPMVDAVGAYHQANVMRHRGEQREGDERTRQDRKPVESGTISQQDFDRLMADLRLEYRQRVVRDGQIQADTWLRSRVAELRNRYRRIE